MINNDFQVYFHFIRPGAMKHPSQQYYLKCPDCGGNTFDDAYQTKDGLFFHCTTCIRSHSVIGMINSSTDIRVHLAR